MLKDQILQEALALIESRRQNNVRCSETGIPVSRIFDEAVIETVESYWLDNPSLNAERLADEWELTHYAVNFRISPAFQRTMIGQSRENRYAHLAKSYGGRARLFVYFLGRAFFPQKRRTDGSLTWYTEKNRFVSECYDWTQSGPEAESLVNETVLNLAILEGMTNLSAYIAQKKIRERISDLLPQMLAVDSETFGKAIDSFVVTLFDTLSKSDDEIQSENARVALPTAIALSQGVTISQEAAAQRSRDMLIRLQQRLTENYGGGKTIVRAITAKQAADRLKPKSESNGSRQPRTSGFKKLSTEAQNELTARFAAALGPMFARPTPKAEESK